MVGNTQERLSINNFDEKSRRKKHRYLQKLSESEHFEENTGFFDSEHHGNVDGIKGRKVVAWL